MTNSTTGLIYGFYLNGDNKGSPCRWEDIESGLPSTPVWLHFDYTDKQAQHWLQQRSEIEPLVADALLSEETRPRTSLINGELLVALRGVNLSPGQDPDDMVSIRIWSDGKHVISTRRRRLLSAQDLAFSIAAGTGPDSAGALICELTANLISRMQQTLGNIDETVDGLEERLLLSIAGLQRGEVAGIRQQVISIRRYLSPQREAMLQLQSEKILWIDNNNRLRLRETTDVLTRYIEDLDSIRDRAAVIHEEINNRLAERMNNRMYVLSIVAAIFLPLGFFTGLLGINVGGIPGSENPYAFMVFCVFLTTIVGIQAWLFKKKGWF
ncbi:zinc transporter ZntB [Aestuariirhabdus sp. LZHN29]|uniref:zinc transporter ZntB n=1 Tax=Aestuariirhabdus sp. LZHN29 TaxID=3417462 RepID=UPI003CE85C91